MSESNVDREALRIVIDDEVLTRTGRSVGDLASGHVADAVLAFLAAQPTPAPVDADAVERAATAALGARIPGARWEDCPP